MTHRSTCHRTRVASQTIKMIRIKTTSTRSRDKRDSLGQVVLRDGLWPLPAGGLGVADRDSCRLSLVGCGGHHVEPCLQRSDPLGGVRDLCPSIGDPTEGEATVVECETESLSARATLPRYFSSTLMHRLPNPSIWTATSTRTAHFPHASPLSRAVQP